MQPINDWIGQLKLRVSYGNLGNQNVGITRLIRRLVYMPTMVHGCRMV